MRGSLQGEKRRQGSESVSSAKEVISMKKKKAFEDTVVKALLVCCAAQRVHLARACHISSCTDDMPITP